MIYNDKKQIDNGVAMDLLLSAACPGEMTFAWNEYSFVLHCVAFNVRALPLYPVHDADGNYMYTHYQVIAVIRDEAE